MATLEELWSRSDVVVEGVIEGEEPADYASGERTAVNTMYDLRVTILYKHSALARTETPVIKVRRQGGTRDRGDHVETALPTNYPMFERGETYILFLKTRTWVPPATQVGTYYSEATYGPDSAFRVEGTSVSTAGISQLARALSAPDAESLRRRLLKVAAGQ